MTLEETKKLAELGVAEVAEAWAALESHGFPPEAMGWPERNIGGLLPEAINVAIDALTTQREDLLAEVIRLRALANQPQAAWQPIETAPKDGLYFSLLWCPEDSSRWIAKWQGGQWVGVDDFGLRRYGASLGDPDVVTGWFVSHWMPLPHGPVVAPAHQPGEAQ